MNYIKKLGAITASSPQETKEYQVARAIIVHNAILRARKASLEKISVPIPIEMMNIGPRLRLRLSNHWLASRLYE